MNSAAVKAAHVIPWSSPVPVFGNLPNAYVATLGLNPSSREFVDEKGNELEGPARRLHTLKSLGLAEWSDAESVHVEKVEECCRQYFTRSPYNEWFRSLDQLISGTGASYYGVSASACHLDLIPYATHCKWTDLTARHRSLLMKIAGNTLGILLRDSPVRLIVVNGKTVTETLQGLGDVAFSRSEMPSWRLQRRVGSGVAGFAYHGWLRRLVGVDLGRPVLVLGFNHNVQSSFGITLQVKVGIRDWITHMASEVVDCGQKM
jgi:hypothetical protein